MSVEDPFTANRYNALLQFGTSYLSKLVRVASPARVYLKGLIVESSAYANKSSNGIPLHTRSWFLCNIAIGATWQLQLSVFQAQSLQTSS